MEERYYLNKNRNRLGVHEVHREDCFYLPLEMNRIYLGEFFVGDDAINKGMEILSNIVKCEKCLGESWKTKGLDMKERKIKNYSSFKKIEFNNGWKTI